MEKRGVVRFSFLARTSFFFLNKENFHMEKSMMKRIIME